MGHPGLSSEPTKCHRMHTNEAPTVTVVVWTMFLSGVLTEVITPHHRKHIKGGRQEKMFYGNLMHVVTLQELISTENVYIYVYVNANME